MTKTKLKTKPRKTTKPIAGHKLTLLARVRYVASCPAVTWRYAPVPVSIQAAIGESPEVKSVVIADLCERDADALIDAFNDGEFWFDGRVW